MDGFEARGDTVENDAGKSILSLIETLKALAAWFCTAELGTAMTGAIPASSGNVVLEVFSHLSITLVDTRRDQNSPTRWFLR